MTTSDEKIAFFNCWKYEMYNEKIENLFHRKYNNFEILKDKTKDYNNSVVSFTFEEINNLNKNKNYQENIKIDYWYKIFCC
jgi:hypothetical protein